MKLCVEAMASDLQLTEEQVDRFVILCGPRCVRRSSDADVVPRAE